MAGLMLFTNNAATTLASGITNVATSLTVAAGTGALFPTLGAGEYFYITIANNAGTVEIVKCTARTTDTLTVTRAQDGTAAIAWNSGDKVELRLVRADLLNFGQLDSTNTWALAQTFSSAASFTSATTSTFTASPTITALNASLPVFTNGTKILTNTGVSPIANGGTNNGSLAVTSGGVVYTDGTKQMTTAAGTSGQILQSNGASAPTWVATPPSGFANMDVITVTNAAYSIPATKIKVTVVGGGGSGGTNSSSYSASAGGGGGGGGGSTIEIISGLTIGATVAVTIGAGGSAGAGGTTSFGTYCSATGGNLGGNGSGTTAAAGGAGGLGANGQINIGGQAGAAGVNSQAVGGIGGSSILGGGGRSGSAGQVYGGGGGGQTSTGALGAQGVVIVEY